MNTVKEFEKIGEVKETRTLNISQRGNGLYLFLPKGLVEVYGLRTGDRIKAKLMDLYRPKKDVQGEPAR